MNFRLCLLKVKLNKADKQYKQILDISKGIKTVVISKPTLYFDLHYLVKKIFLFE